MKVVSSSRLRLALALFAASSGLLAASGCAGGWGELPPAIASQITGHPVTAGQTETLFVTPTGTGPFTFQWYKNGVLIPGATASTYSTSTTAADNGDVFTVTVSNAGGSTSTQKYVLVVNVPPAIVVQPASKTVTAGQIATFAVTATGTAPLAYQWSLHGTAIYGANSPTYTTPVTSVTDSGSPYTVSVTNAFGSAASATADLTVSPETPNLAFVPVPDKLYGAQPFPVSAASASTGAVVYSVVSGPATLAGSTVTLTGIGTVVLQATQAAAGNYTTATATTSFTVARETPTLAFAPIPAKTFGNAPFAVSATSASSGAVTYSVVSGPATISGSTLTLTGAGPVVISANQAAAGDYTSASATTTFTAAPAVPTLAFAPIPAQTFGNPAFPVLASSASDGAITYSVASGPATVTGSTVSITGAGALTLRASQAATANYTAATATTTLTIAPEVPPLAFTPVSTKVFGSAPFGVTASSPSSGAIFYSLVSGPATVSASTVSLTGIGSVVIQATQSAAGNYAAGTATTSFSVSAEVPTLSFAPISQETFGNPAFPVSASSASSGAVTYSVLSGPATVAGSTVTLTGAGEVIIQASQAAAGNYAAATQVLDLVVARGVPTLAFAPIPTETYGNAPFPVSATSASTGAVTYSVLSGPASVSGSLVTVTGAGPVTLTASQAATSNYIAATATTTFTVAPNVTVTPISPAGLTIAPGTETFSATATGGATDNLSWTATGGSFSGNVWTSPNTPGTYTITATSVDEPSRSASTTITVTAPVITTQPISQNICASGSATLSVTANYANSYQWNLNGAPISGATAANYFIASANAGLDAGNYTVSVTNPAGTVTSNAATIAVGSVITTNPISLSIYATQTATFNVAASGKSPFTYQWYSIPSGSTSGSAIAGATSASYATPSTDTTYNGTQYYAVVTDACGAALTSSSATLSVTAGNVPPTITTEPLGQTTTAGGTPTFTVAAAGTAPLTYQWYQVPAGSQTGSAISGATSASYTVPASATTTSNDQDHYFVIVSNSYGQAASQSVPLVVGNGIMVQITDEPGTVFVNAGEPATFHVHATSLLPLVYQWYRAEPGSSTFNPVSGADTDTYTLQAPSDADTGAVYHVTVGNGQTPSVTSNGASLFVGALANIPNCSGNWNMLGTTTESGTCAYQLTAATTGQYGLIVWPTLLSTSNIQLSFTIATSNPSSPPADGFAVVLGDPSLGATLTSTGAVGEGLGARGIPGFVLAFDDYENNASGGWPQDPPVPYLGVGRGEDALWENPYFNVNTAIPALAASGQTVSHAYIVSIHQGYMNVTMDGSQVFSGNVSVPPVAYLYVTSSTGGSWEQTVISNVSATVAAP